MVLNGRANRTRKKFLRPARCRSGDDPSHAQRHLWTDYKIYRERFRPLPRIMGHEMIGVVVEPMAAPEAR
jgi:hypothetical protein